MEIRYYWDSETGQPHIYKHGLWESEVEEALKYLFEDRSGRNGSRIAIGQTESGKYLRVIYIHDNDPDSIFIITAYELKGKQLAAFKRRWRKQ